MHNASASKVVIAYPHGFCAGVVHAIEIARQALARYAPPVYCLNEIVHNEIVVKDLQESGMIFVRDLAAIPESSVVLFSAHGVPPSVRQAAAARKLRAIDATCPFVARIHEAVKQYAAKKYNIFVIGHRDHEEIIGLTGEAPANIKTLCSVAEAETIEPIFNNGLSAVVTQTTLSVTEAQEIISVLQRRFPHMEKPSRKGICYATENRQNAVRQLCAVADLILVLGSRNSSNTQRLREIARANTSAPVVLLSCGADFKSVPLNGIKTPGITAGASTPELFVEEILDALKQKGFVKIEKLVVAREHMGLKLPPGLR